jgi:hypothetical protein
MQLKYAQVLAGIQAAQGFLDSNRDALGEITSGLARKAFDDVANTLSSLADKQGEHNTRSAGELKEERRLAQALRLGQMHLVVRVARLRVPAAAQLDAVRLPRSRSNSTLLVSAARSMANAVEPFKQLLVEGGLPVDFMEQLRGAANALAASVGTKADHLSKRVGATDGIESEVREARGQLNLMDALVRGRLPETSSLLTEWRRLAKRIRSAATRASKAPGGTPVAGTPAAGSPATGTSSAGATSAEASAASAGAPAQEVKQAA